MDRQNVVDARYSVSVYNHAALSEEYAVNAQNYALFSEQIPSEMEVAPRDKLSTLLTLLTLLPPLTHNLHC